MQKYINKNLDEIWVHIRSLGNWTNKLNQYFNDYNIILNKMNKLDDVLKVNNIELTSVNKISTKKPKVEKRISNYSKYNRYYCYFK